MNTIPIPAIIDFEVYLLITMKARLVNRQNFLEAKLSEFDISVDEALRVHAKVAEALGGRTSRFENMKAFLGVVSNSESLKYESVLWPEFDFSATANESGLLDSAGYIRTRGAFRSVNSPTELIPWSTDIAEFTHQFGPMVDGRRWHPTDKILPGYEEYEFLWKEDRYGVGFGWGLFLYASKYWPED
ncbi:hypothetical protein [Mycobacteroides chelonae]|uniref:hypothetical protein n=1 Tax=Mycobacteroides chelonae TaxID=1774 RepID=UPI0007A0F719|nr:hypothetical protein [Mycobacteroides chelonae]AMW19448.1 hypothetical protein Chelonae_p1697 [Mycobacterium sp. QIA-37]